MSERSQDPTSESNVANTRAGRRLEYFTLGWNLIEAAVAISAGAIAGSIALVGFGADSLIESLSGGILLWRLQTHADEKREQIALKLVGISFLVLALYVAGDAVWSLFRREEPETSWIGIVLSTVSLIVMPILARAKRRVRRPPAEPRAPRRLPSDRHLRLSLRDSSPGAAPECALRLVVGRFRRCAPHGADHFSGRAGSFRGRQGLFRLL
ncbi:hypothetical protein BH20VER3_BH20VER3_02080 [soil metagenome]